MVMRRFGGSGPASVSFSPIVIAPVVRLIVLLGQFVEFNCEKSTVSPEDALLTMMLRKLRAPLSAQLVTCHVAANACGAASANSVATLAASGRRRAPDKAVLTGLFMRRLRVIVDTYAWRMQRCAEPNRFQH